MVDTDDGEHTHTVTILAKVCDEPIRELAVIEVPHDTDLATEAVAMAMHSIANVLDHNRTFEELVRGL